MTTYPFDDSSLSPEDQERARKQFDSIIASGGEYSQAQQAAERYIQDCQNPPGEFDQEISERLKNGYDIQYVGKEEENNQPKKMNPKTFLITLLIAGIVVTIGLGYRYFYDQKPSTVNPLSEIVQIRSQAAFDLQSAVELEKIASSNLAKAKARYEASYKKELCTINNNCKK